MVDKAYQKANNGLNVVDNIDGDITDTTQVTASTVNTAVVGTPVQTITATDLAGNVETKTVTITVVEPPPAEQNRSKLSKK